MSDIPLKMIRVDNNFGVKLDLRNYEFDDREEINDLVKSFGGKFYKEHKKFPNIGYFYRIPTEFITSCLKALYTFFGYHVPEEVHKLHQELSESSFHRASVDTSLLKYPPKGDFQTDSIRRGLENNRLCWFLDMGMGKSYISISTLNHRITHSGVDKVLILCPPEGVYNYLEELINFSVPEVTEDDVYIVTPTTRDPFNSDKKFVICTYRRLLMICTDVYSKKKKSITNRIQKPVFDLSKWGTKRALIMDESHNLRNRDSIQTVLTYLHSQFFEYRYQLTGTMIPKGVENLWSQLRILDKYAIGLPYQTFVEEIASTGTKHSSTAIREYKAEGIDKWNRKLAPWIDRKNADDYLDLPPLTEQRVYCELSPAQKKIYQLIVQTEFNRIKEDSNGVLDIAKVQNKTPYLLQALDDPCLLKGKIDKASTPELHSLVSKWKFEDHGKVEILDSLVQKHIKDNKEKMIIWSGHPDTIDNLANRYKKHGAVGLHGQTKNPTGFTTDTYRKHMQDVFEDPNSDVKILILSYIAFSTSITLLQAKSSFWWDMPTDYVFWGQARKRNYRLGQEDPVISYDSMFRNTLEVTSYESLKDGKGLRNMWMFRRTGKVIDKQDWQNFLMGKDYLSLEKKFSNC